MVENDQKHLKISKKSTFFNFSSWALCEPIVHMMKKVLFTHFQVFLIDFDHANAYASMPSLVKIHNKYFLNVKASLLYDLYHYLELLIIILVYWMQLSEYLTHDTYPHSGFFPYTLKFYDVWNFGVYEPFPLESTCYQW